MLDSEEPLKPTSLELIQTIASLLGVENVERFKFERFSLKWSAGNPEAIEYFVGGIRSTPPHVLAHHFEYSDKQ